MARKKQLIVPIFIPFGGCTHKCVFCNQTGITGEDTPPTPGEVESTIERYLSTWLKAGGSGRREVAFYGGSFTALAGVVQQGYLECAYGFIRAGRVDALRVSTRPDCVSSDALELLRRFGVQTVELGVQSMSNEVLGLSGRGHKSEATVGAARRLKSAGFSVGMQIMPGLPGDTRATFTDTVKRVIELGPGFVRVYPTLVMKNTPLHKMYLKGEYEPWSLPATVEVLKEAMALFKGAGIPVVRVGLHYTEELERNVAAGPCHPRLRQLV